MTRLLPRGSITLLGIVAMALTPFVLVLAFRESLSWSGGALLFYVTLALAEIGYVGLLVVAARRSGMGSGGIAA